LERVTIGSLTLDWPEDRKPDPTDCISSCDYRYWDPAIARFFSPRGIHSTYLAIELAVVKAFRRLDMCNDTQVLEVRNACQEITTLEIFEREVTTQHDVQAVVEAIQGRVSDGVKQLVHGGGTSYDIVCTANAVLMRDCASLVIIPELRKLLRLLIVLAEEHADTPQTGRSHLQHGSPITFGFWAAEYISRISEAIPLLEDAARRLKGKYRGAMGNSLALTFLVADPLAFEWEVLSEFQLKPALYSSQVVPHDDTARLLSELTVLIMILSNLGEDIRLMAATEIGELVQELRPGESGSTAMPDKVNPWRAESVCSAARTVVGRLVTVMLNCETDLQRDLRDSLASRTYGETFNLILYAIKKASDQLSRMRVNKEALDRNLLLTNGGNLSEAWQAALRAVGHPTAHLAMKELAKVSRQTGEHLSKLAFKDPDLAPYIAKMAPETREALKDPAKCTGLASVIARRIADSAAVDHGINT